jgi:alpha-tubulin suppressor-like RCC1 family protein
MFVGADEQIMGFGFRVQGKADQSAMRLIDRPTDCRDYKKVAIGKFFRIILTKQNRLFFNGQNKHHTIARMCDDLNSWVDAFHEITSLFPLEAGDKIIDCDGGQHFIIVCTEKGKVYCSGYKMWNYVSSDVRQGGGEEAFEMKLTPGVGDIPTGKEWGAERVWGQKNNKNCYALLYNKANPEEKLSVAIGAPSHLGAGEDVSNDEKWHAIKLKDDRYIVDIAGKHQYTVAIDNKGDVWEWGQYNSNQPNKDGEGEEKLFETFDGSEPAGKKPKQFVWLRKRHLSATRVTAFRAGTIIEVKNDETGRISYYSNKEASDDQLRGAGFKVAYGEKWGELENWCNDGQGLVDFCSATQATFTIKKMAISIPPSIVPNKPEDRRLTHFFKKQNGQWEVLD